MTTDPTRAAEIVVRAEKAIALGKATGSDGSRLPSNIYVIAEELLALVQRPTDTARAGKPVAWMRRWKFDNNEGTKGNRPKGWTLLAVSDSKLLDDDVPLYLTATPSPVTDETALSGEAERYLEAEYIADGLSGLHAIRTPEEKRALRAIDAALASTPQPATVDDLPKFIEALARIAETDWHTRNVKPNPNGGIRGKAGMIAAFALTGRNGSFIGDKETRAAADELLAAIRQSAKGGE